MRQLPKQGKYYLITQQIFQDLLWSQEMSVYNMQASEPCEACKPEICNPNIKANCKQLAEPNLGILSACKANQSVIIRLTRDLM